MGGQTLPVGRGESHLARATSAAKIKTHPEGDEAIDDVTQYMQQAAPGFGNQAVAERHHNHLHVPLVHMLDNIRVALLPDLDSGCHQICHYLLQPNATSCSKQAKCMLPCEKIPSGQILLAVDAFEEG